jgi:hypothetical protein
MEANAMSREWIPPNQTNAADRLVTPTGLQEAAEIATALMAVLDRIDAYLDRHGDECDCDYCRQPDESGSRAGVIVADTLAGSIALLTMLAGAIDSHSTGPEQLLAEAPAPDESRFIES